VSGLLGALQGRTGSGTVELTRVLRAVGRLERPALAARVIPLLAHPVAAVRSAAAQALAQAAQGFRADSSRLARETFWPPLLEALGRRVAEERDPGVRGMLALSLGRLPYDTEGELVRADTWLLALGGGLSGEAQAFAARGMESFVRATVRRRAPSEALGERLRAWAADGALDARARRAALGGLLLARRTDDAVLAAALDAADPQLRRLALTGLSANTPSRDARLDRALGDSALLVRIEALRVAARVRGAAACPTLRRAAADPVPVIALLGVDLLGSTCRGDSAAGRVVAGVLDAPASGWHAPAHALLSLARLAPEQARSALPAAMTATTWQTRMYAARAAGLLRDSTALGLLARDPEPNVREAALSALRETAGHWADSLYRAALTGERLDYQLTLTAAQALAGSPEREQGAVALLRALDRITRERSETSRDTRIALLVRLRELGDPRRDARALDRYLEDFDSRVADSAAAILSAWTGRLHDARPRPLPPEPVSAAALERLRGQRLRITMADGGVIEIALEVDDAPLSVLRVTRLAAQGWYDGLTLHRVVPNFVLQGGSPGANEYAGHPRYMPDEPGPRSHERGTLGISTRGRDTGDAQFFVNMVDNPRLDYEYTVWGRVVRGMDVMDRILEGAVIRKVELMP